MLRTASTDHPSSLENDCKNFKEALPSELLPLGTKQILMYGEAEAAVPAQYGYDYKKTASSKGELFRLLQ